MSSLLEKLFRLRENATTPALIVVGLFMFRNLREIGIFSALNLALTM
ncbi:MAG: hypothetical protein U5K31_07950 [Balneolaceae bacterium]|nr:hypothetical protein [Balneolaceae bacterium]